MVATTNRIALPWIDPSDRLAIETAFIGILPWRRITDYGKEANDVRSMISTRAVSYSGVDIHTMQPFPCDNIYTYARFIGNQPMGEAVGLGRDISKTTKDMLVRENSRRIYILSLGETLSPGRGELQFHGTHVTNAYRKLDSLSRKDELDYLSGESPHGESQSYVVGIVEVDNFFNSFEGVLAQYGLTHNKDIQVKITDSLKAIRSWLEVEPREAIGGDPDCPRGYSAKKSDEVCNALELLLIECIQNLDFDYIEYHLLDRDIFTEDEQMRSSYIDMLCARFEAIKASESWTIKKRRMINDDFKLVPPADRAILMSSTLADLYERNQKAISKIQDLSMRLGALSLPTLAVIYPAIANMWFINAIPLFSLVFAISFHFLATFLSFSLWHASCDEKSSWVFNLFARLDNMKKFFLPKTESEPSNAFNPTDEKTQAKFCGKEEEFYYEMRKLASGGEIVLFSSATRYIISDLTRSAEILVDLRDFMKTVVGLFKVALGLYAIAAVIYFIIWVFIQLSG